MISYIKGTLIHIGDDFVIVDNKDIGYEIKVPISHIAKLPSIGDKLIIYTYLYVREDAMMLYGFLSKDDLEVFKLLITVNGIGPKGALGILSAITTNELRLAVASNDEKTISKAPGIGKKTAQRLIIDLKDKLKLENLNEISSIDNSSVSGELTDPVNEAIAALIALEYTQAEAIKAVKSVKEFNNVEDLIKKALKKLAFL